MRVHRTTNVALHFQALRAAQTGRINELQELLSNHSFSPFTDRINMAAHNNLLAIAAAASGQLQVIKWLVESGQPVDLTAQNNRTLNFAVESGDLELVRWLILESGQLIDVTLNNNYAIKLATKAGFSDIATFLSSVSKLEHGGTLLNQLAVHTSS